MEKKIAVLPGDGIGPEVTHQAIKALDAIAERYGHRFFYNYSDVGAVAIDHHGTPLPEETLDNCKAADAVLFGAIGHPKYDNDPTAKVRPEQGLLALRKSLELFANIRPVTTYKNLLHLSPLKEERVKGADFVIYRELTGGIYFGEKGRSEDGETAYDHCVYHRFEVERIVDLAFKAARLRKKKVTLVDKANVLESSRFWRETTYQIAKSYPDVKLEVMFVDNAAMQLIQYPQQFDVVVTENMFGDILSDEASVLTGSMGLLPSASIGTHTSLFEPIHGSFPQAAGEDTANPMATILSAAMMIDSFGMNEEAETIRSAVQHILEHGIGTAELSPTIVFKCSQIGDLVAQIITDEDLKLSDDKLNARISTII